MGKLTGVRLAESYAELGIVLAFTEPNQNHQRLPVAGQRHVPSEVPWQLPNIGGSMNDDEDAQDKRCVEEMQRSVETVLLAHVPECAEYLDQQRNYNKPISPYLLLWNFGSDFLLPELRRNERATDLIRRIYAAVEELLSDDNAVISEAAYFGAIEPLGSAVEYLSPKDVGMRVREEIENTYRNWSSSRLDKVGD